MECFRIDESGYTGFDLLNREQPFQGAAAIAIEDDDAARLIKAHFPKLQADELKYRALSRRSSNHPRLLGLLRDVLSGYKCVTYVCDKRFLLILMFLDYAIEPYYYERGVDFYRDGRNYALASLIAKAGPTLLGKAALDDMLAAFQGAVKEKSPEAFGALVAAARRTKWRALREELAPLTRHAAPECFEAIATPGVTTDAAMVVLQSLITRMEIMAVGTYRVEHDQSKNLLTYHELIRSFIDHDKPVELYQTEITSLKFPLKLTEVTQVDSRTSPAVQLADVMVGAALEAANTITGHRSGGLDPEAVIPLFGAEQFIHLIPDVDFAAQKRFRQGSQALETIDYIAANILAPVNGQPKS